MHKIKKSGFTSSVDKFMVNFERQYDLSRKKK